MLLNQKEARQKEYSLPYKCNHTLDSLLSVCDAQMCLVSSDHHLPELQKHD